MLCRWSDRKARKLATADLSPYRARTIKNFLPFSEPNSAPATVQTISLHSAVSYAFCMSHDSISRPFKARLKGQSEPSHDGRVSDRGRKLYAICAEMKNVRVAFEEFEGKTESPVGCTEITCHLVFDVKLGENYRRKARFVADVWFARSWGVLIGRV
jgi:hypothetical protein